MEQNTKIDVKHIGVPNICFSLSGENHSQADRFKVQRLERGFDDSELWSLRDTIANFIIPRLEAYEGIVNDEIVRSDKLKNNINNFLNAMKLILRDGGSMILTKEETRLLHKGLEAFPKIFLSLWW